MAVSYTHLLYVNAFDDASAKPKGKELPSIGISWLGKLGLITAKGDNLFEKMCIRDSIHSTRGRDMDRCWFPTSAITLKVQGERCTLAQATAL